MSCKVHIKNNFLIILFGCVIFNVTLRRRSHEINEQHDENLPYSTEIKTMIDGLENLNNEDVKIIYGVDSVEEAETLLWEEAVESEAEYEGMDCFQSQIGIQIN